MSINVFLRHKFVSVGQKQEMTSLVSTRSYRQFQPKTFWSFLDYSVLYTQWRHTHLTTILWEFEKISFKRIWFQAYQNFLSDKVFLKRRDLWFFSLAVLMWRHNREFVPKFNIKYKKKNLHLFFSRKITLFFFHVIYHVWPVSYGKRIRYWNVIYRGHFVSRRIINTGFCRNEVESNQGNDFVWQARHAPIL